MIDLSVIAIVEHTDGNGDTSIILVQSHGWPSEWFGLVTGFLEANENPERGVLREAKEELGLDAKLVSLIGVYDNSRANQVHIDPPFNITIIHS
jgi:NAD+ diphosphatase